MNQYKNPNWWTNENDSAWERTKAAFKRDWDQTKHDMGGQEPDTNQKIGNTTRQAAGNEIIPPRGVPAYDEVEPAYRFGHGAHSHYGDDYPEWDDKLETQLRRDWEEIAPQRKQTWMQDRAAIRRGWDYDEGSYRNRIKSESLFLLKLNPIRILGRIFILFSSESDAGLISFLQEWVETKNSQVQEQESI